MASPALAPEDLLPARASTARRVLVEAGILGIVADGAIRTAPGGLGWTVFVVALCLAALNTANRQGRALTGEQIGWLFAAAGCAVGFAWRDAEELRLLNVFGTLVAVSLFAMSTDGRPAPSILLSRVRDVIAAGVYAFRDVVLGAPMLVLSDARLNTLPAVQRGASWTALRALVITLPLVIVFASLLSSADPVFASLFRVPDAERFIEHAVVIGAFTWWSAGWLRGALLGVARRPAVPDIPVRLGRAEITTALGAVIALFAIFVTLQLRWLFGGADMVLTTTGLTIAEYARRGFFELVMVAFLVAPLILATRALIDDDNVIRRHRVLSMTLIVLLVPIMASALLRMKLYIANFGLTTDRFYATAVMIWLAIVLLAMARTVLFGWSRPFAAMSVLSGFATLLALNVINPDRLVARVNLDRPSIERGIDYAYLARLSGDAIPTVVSALEAAAPSAESCKAAQSIHERWSEEQSAWNVGIRMGRDAVASGFSMGEVQRLCAGITGSTP